MTTDLFLGCEQYLLFDLLPLAILAVEKIGQLRRLGFVLCEQNLERFLGIAQSPGCIKSRTKAEADMLR